ncbi:LysR family transcriptional regulator [Psychrobacter sp. Sarcosine-02u-2]|uniref:LysR family transcriptional regulator n=3 Tax=Moraxellaceae TaxID=468 RepID=UPI0007F34A8B|nr:MULTISPECIES: LysR family transcriptional regulator [Psychrobacter]MBO6199190.1 LysR family transcriptional regulator [Psychrobacter sp.]MBK3394646.1 LysR family transcriptional regulator [Psychrobacter sp. M9-54-1]MDN5694037.1 LysR substrate-binding domain-containing protein [Psychrobacter sp.]OAP71050.1 LysR family transcriptional regulator [Psychrobacter sp. SHUES1]PKG84617.1 LysR family transcriptional regulator [Psychrobacter sp. Sarcosine-02u-2]
MNISIRQLSAFISVADNGSFTRASEQMHLTQSAVSGLIKELESSLGIVLFDRTTRQLSLSVVGHHLLPQARRILNEMQLFENEASSLTSLAQGQVRLAVSQFAASSMPAVIAQFAKAYPDISVSLLDCSAENVLEHIQNIEVDLGVGTERGFTEPDDDISADLLYQLPFCVVMPDNHALAQKSEVIWQDLVDTPLITLQGPFIEQVTAELDEEIASHIQQARYKVNFMSTALEMTRQGFGITLCLPYMPEVIDWVSANGLQMRPLAQPVKMRRFFIYQRSSRALSPASIAFKQFLQTYFASHFDDLQRV